jgi:hypothetical protein
MLIGYCGSGFLRESYLGVRAHEKCQRATAYLESLKIAKDVFQLNDGVFVL